MFRNGLVLVVLCGIVALACVAAEPVATAVKEVFAEGQIIKTAPKRHFVYSKTGVWLVHDSNRPEPPVVTPGMCGTPDKPGTAPSDAVVLFNGRDLKGWKSKEPWVVRDGALESVKGAGYITSEKHFGSCQLHLEFATPSTVQGSSQGRGNSGVFLMGMYEVQILDSYDNRTYADGHCSALYGRNVPEVNSSRRPGQWQSYDIIFHRPTFRDGKVDRKATFTVLHNGVLVHDHVVLQGGTDWRGPHMISDYRPHGDKGPIQLQDHGNPVRFRNIWVRELQD